MGNNEDHKKATGLHLPDPMELAKTWDAIAAKTQHIIEGFIAKQSQAQGASEHAVEAAILLRPLQTFMERTTQDPSRLVEAQIGLWQDTLTLWQRAGMRAIGMEPEPVVKPAKGDKRFRDEAWDDNPIFDFIKQSYLLAAKYVAESLPEVDGSDDKRGQQLEFYARQLVDAMSPSNFAAANPAVLRETVDTGGENLVNGLKNLLDDLERGKGSLRIKMAALDKFEVGKNVGTSPGKVVFENELMQLIQYQPATEKVYQRPLLVVPPWINKFYILDLQPKNSFIKWAVERGHTVFVISWVNPGGSLSDKRFDDYLLEGPLAALDAMEQATGAQGANLVGYCLGGTLLSCTMAYLAEKGDNRVKSATYFASLADFSEPGELGLFIDDDHLALIDQHMERDGYLDGATMASTFNALRANDLIWSFVINNYLMGKEPFAFDLLYWNSDSTRMPKAMHQFYLHEMYVKNRLVEAGSITLDDTPIDLGAVQAPALIIATKDDHIAPWQASYKSVRLYGGSVRFLLGGSGHIAGIINPPSANKYGYWSNSELAETAAGWFDGAEHKDGSWWPEWQAWVRRYGGKKVAARVPGDGGLAVIEDAPGRYVQVGDID